MSKKQAIIVFPHLNDCGGDLSQKWYVEFRWRIPGESKQRKERIYKGVYMGSEKERRKEAAKIIKEKTEWLKSGAYLQGNERKVYADELLYRNEAKKYGEAHEQVVTTRTNLSEFLKMMKQKVNHKSYENYQSKLRIFNSWLEDNKLNELHIKNITRQHIIAFSMWLSDDQKLSRLTIKKYIQNVHTFFDFELDRDTIQTNPAERIPPMGKIVDCAAVPFQKDERAMLKEAIATKDPQLWLACQIQYYCAIRPGMELRLMQIKWIDFEKCTFRIPPDIAKNDKTGIVGIPPFLIAEMKSLQLHLFSDKDLYVFGKFGRPGDVALGKNTLRNRFNQYRDQLGISEEHKFYSWKHTGAIALLDNGAKPYDIKTHLRHSSFSTTEEYLKKRVVDNNMSKFSTEI